MAEICISADRKLEVLNDEPPESGQDVVHPHHPHHPHHQTVIYCMIGSGVIWMNSLCHRDIHGENLSIWLKTLAHSIF